MRNPYVKKRKIKTGNCCCFVAPSYVSNAANNSLIIKDCPEELHTPQKETLFVLAFNWIKTE